MTKELVAEDTVNKKIKVDSFVVKGSRGEELRQCSCSESLLFSVSVHKRYCKT